MGDTAGTVVGGTLVLVRGIGSALASAFAGSGSQQSNGQVAAVSAALLNVSGGQDAASAAPTPRQNPIPALALSPASQDPKPPAASSSPAPQPAQTQHSSIVPGPTAAPITPGFGGGGGPQHTDDAVAAPSSSSSSATSSLSASSSISFSITSPSDGALFATTSVSFIGTSNAGALITATLGTTTASTSADSAGAWSLALTIPEGSASVAFTADVSGTSVSLSRSLTVDITAPAAPTASVDACSVSLSPSFCLIAGTNTNVSWPAVADASSYIVAVNGAIVASTTATSTSVALTIGATTTIAVAAYDSADNAATSSSQQVFAITNPLVINEIGWGGTKSDQTNQWLELKNTSVYTLDLSHVSVARSGGSAIALSGTLSAGSSPYLIVDRAALGSTASGQTITNTFSALATTTAEQLSLVWNGTTLDSTPAASDCSGHWCAGLYSASLGTSVETLQSLVTPLSMERISASSDGTISSNWRSTDSYGPYLSGQGELWGTPYNDNSAGYPDSGVLCASGLVVANSSINPGSGGCTYLMRFITGSTGGGHRFASMYEGDVGSSTQITGHSLGLALAGFGGGEAVPAGTAAGQHFFFAIFESRTFAPDTTTFNTYFSTGSNTPPHGNYLTIPWTYQP